MLVITKIKGECVKPVPITCSVCLVYQFMHKLMLVITKIMGECVKPSANYLLCVLGVSILAYTYAGHNKD